MPHVIIEHSSNIPKILVKSLQAEIQNIMTSIVEGNFDADQCKARSFGFDEYLVGKSDQSSASFLHITIKILSGRSTEVRKKLAEKISDFAQKIFAELVSKGLDTKRCDISVDVVEMDRDVYQKLSWKKSNS